MKLFKAGNSLSIILIINLILCFKICHQHGHGHSHDHDDHSHDQPASFKYSRQANERVVSHDHAHSHGVHGHSHDTPDHGSHGHSHEHDDHAHSHGGHGHSHETPDHGSHGHSHEHDDHEFHAHSHGSHEHSHDQGGPSLSIPNIVRKNTEETNDVPEYNVWLWALGATLLVSSAPVLILFLIPLDNSNSHEAFLKVLLSFASGGLLGDAFLHLIPHAISPHSHHSDSHEHSHAHSHSHSEVNEETGGHSHGHEMGVGIWILAGIVTFLAVEKFVRIIKEDGGHGHSHHTTKKSDKKNKIETNKTLTLKNDENIDNNKETSTKEEKKGSNKEQSDLKNKKKNKEIIEGEPETKIDTLESIKVGAYLNLAADFTHNFTDGLAIGASFLINKNIGLVTTATILLHEVPHEIGDFAILVQAGYSKKKAMALQLTTALGALTGTVCSLLAEGIGDYATSWILPFTAGGFIYIATVSVIPELLNQSTLGQSIKEILAMLAGIAMMVVIAKLE